MRNYCNTFFKSGQAWGGLVRHETISHVVCSTKRTPKTFPI